jgi:hypothetical protein
MFDYTDDTIELIKAILAAGAVVFFVMILLAGIADIIRDAFFS